MKSRKSHCKHYHVEDFRLQKIETESFLQNIQLEFFVTEIIPHGKTFSEFQHHGEVTCEFIDDHKSA